MREQVLERGENRRELVEVGVPMSDDRPGTDQNGAPLLTAPPDAPSTEPWTSTEDT